LLIFIGVHLRLTFLAVGEGPECGTPNEIFFARKEKGLATALFSFNMVPVLR